MDEKDSIVIEKKMKTVREDYEKVMKKNDMKKEDQGSLCCKDGVRYSGMIPACSACVWGE